jgi:DNA-directed RNA polymerases I and III subunit RPAC1
MEKEIDVQMHAVMGIGQDHAKFSPVGAASQSSTFNELATASYRLHPVIEIVSPIINDDAEKFVKCFPKGVAQIRVDNTGMKRAEIVNSRLDTVSREVLRHEEFKEKVKLGRVRDHFICTQNDRNPTNTGASFYREHRRFTA